MNEDDRKRLGLEVASARTQKGWSKEKAAREAGVSSITWKRVEDGDVVQDASLAVILGAVGFNMHGDVLTPDTPPQRDIVDRVAELESRLAELERRLR
jgi:DNA-binding XRE family transcriptional regulator